MVIMRHQFFSIISQNPDYVKTYCNDLTNQFLFASCRWMINQSFEKLLKLIVSKNIIIEYHLSRPFERYIIGYDS